MEEVYHRGDMSDTKVRIRIQILFILCVLCICVYVLPTLFLQQKAQTAYLQVHFLDVGQGDSALIETPTGVQVLVDGGANASVLRRLSKKTSFFDRDIDVVIGTHPDKDHIGGLIDVLERYTVGMILTTENKGETDTSALYNKLKTAEGAEIILARRGQEIHLDASTTLRILFPDSDPKDMETNTSSIVFQLIYGDSVFMFTGDSPKSIEEYLVLVEGESLKSDVLKLGHHGSRTSTSKLYLDEVRPAIAIVSAGKDNSYGHPHVEVTDLLFNKRIEVLETSKEGTITLLSDGNSVWQE